MAQHTLADGHRAYRAGVAAIPTHQSENDYLPCNHHPHKGMLQRRTLRVLRSQKRKPRMTQNGTTHTRGRPPGQPRWSRCDTNAPNRKQLPPMQPRQQQWYLHRPTLRVLQAEKTKKITLHRRSDIKSHHSKWAEFHLRLKVADDQPSIRLSVTSVRLV